MVSSLDEAKTDAAEMTAAVQTITKKLFKSSLYPRNGREQR